jgi:hypothetical protein
MRKSGDRVLGCLVLALATSCATHAHQPGRSLASPQDATKHLLLGDIAFFRGANLYFVPQGRLSIQREELHRAVTAALMDLGNATDEELYAAWIARGLRERGPVGTRVNSDERSGHEDEMARAICRWRWPDRLEVSAESRILYIERLVFDGAPRTEILRIGMVGQQRSARYLGAAAGVVSAWDALAMAAAQQATARYSNVGRADRCRPELIAPLPASARLLSKGIHELGGGTLTVDGSMESLPAPPSLLGD